MEKSNYNKNLKNFARENRTDGTIAEATLWKLVLKAKQTGYQFNRQYPIGPFIVDFICRKLKLVIEIDGSSHSFDKVAARDSKKQKYLQDRGYEILRFSEYEVIKKLQSVTNSIAYTIEILDKNK